MNTVFQKVQHICPNQKRTHGHSPTSVRAHQHVEVVLRLVPSHVMDEPTLLELRMNYATSVINRMKVRNVEKDRVQPIGKRVHLENVQHHVVIMELKREKLLAKKYWKMGKFKCFLEVNRIELLNENWNLVLHSLLMIQCVCNKSVLNHQLSVNVMWEKFVLSGILELGSQ